MAVAFDAASDSAEFVSGTPATWTHTPVGTPRGVIVYITQADGTNDVFSGVTYGGVAMTRIPDNGRAVDTAIEIGAVYAYFLGTGIPTGAQTVSIAHANNEFSTKHAVCFTVTADRDTEIVASGKVEEDAANPTVTLDSGAKVAFKSFGLFSGRDVGNVTNPTGITRFIGEQVASAPRSRFYGYRTTPGSGSETVSQTATSDDAAMIGTAIAEVDEVVAADYEGPAFIGGGFF